MIIRGFKSVENKRRQDAGIDKEVRRINPDW